MVSPLKIRYSNDESIALKPLGKYSMAENFIYGLNNGLTLRKLTCSVLCLPAIIGLH